MKLYGMFIWILKKSEFHSSKQTAKVSYYFASKSNYNAFYSQNLLTGEGTIISNKVFNLAKHDALICV